MGNMAALLLALMTIGALPIHAKTDSVQTGMEMPTGKEEFWQLVTFLQSHRDRYVYIDTVGHRHEFRSVRLDPVTHKPSEDGPVFWVEVSCRRNVAERRLGPVEYVIDVHSVRPQSRDSSSARIAFSGYREFLDRRVLEH